MKKEDLNKISNQVFLSEDESEQMYYKCTKRGAFFIFSERKI